jgi:hypothetical protein
MIWKLLGWLFNRKPKALPPYEEALLASYQKEKEEQRERKRIREEERRRKHEKQEKEEQERCAELAKLKAEGAKPADVKRAFEHIGKVLAEEANTSIFIGKSHLGLTQKRFTVFQQPFVEICQKLGLEAKCECHSWIIIT